MNILKHLALTFLFIFLVSGVQSKGFITTWKPSGKSIIIPTKGIGYNYQVTWKNLTNPGVNEGQLTNVTGDASLEGLSSNDLYEIEITGDFPRIFFDKFLGDHEEIKSIEHWGSIKWTSFENAFSFCTKIQLNAKDAPKLKKVRSMRNMFFSCHDFTGNASMNKWKTKKVTDMSGMFVATEFNSNISSWNTSSVTNMSRMFHGAISFNQDISRWDTHSVKSMNSMFNNAPMFNSNISNWNTSSVEDMSDMFSGAGYFQQDLKSWDISSIKDESKKFDLAPVQIPKSAFITIWKPKSDRLELPIKGFNYHVSWKNISNPGEKEGRITNVSSSEVVLTGLSSNDKYEISITGDFDRINFGSWRFDDKKQQRIHDEYKEQILSIKQWGEIKWTSFYAAFNGCVNLEIHATDVPNLSLVYDLREMFDGCTKLKGNESMNHWNTDSIRLMGRMFRNCRQFNTNIGDWNTSLVKDMSSMFENAEKFNKNISSWNVSSVESMTKMFYYAKRFNQDIGEWNTKSLTEKSGMFDFAKSFDQDISGWDLSSLKQKP